MNELKEMSKYGQFPRHELVSMGLVSPFTGHLQDITGHLQKTSRENQNG